MQRKTAIMLSVGALVLVLVVFVIERLSNERNFYKTRTIKVSGNEYVVYAIPGRPKSESVKAAMLLDQIRRTLLQLLDKSRGFIKEYPWKLNDPKVLPARISRAESIMRDSRNVSEVVDSRDDANTSYTLGKTRMFLCIRKGYVTQPRSDSEPPSFELYPLEVVLYPAVHELAHMLDTTLSTESNHTEQFKEMNGFLLSVARHVGIPVSASFGGKYCGMKVPT